MTLKHMQIFLEVCRQGSITIAADELNMTQPAVSVAISKLEEFYDIKLFDRMNRTIYLTDAGKKLLTYAVSIVQKFDDMKNDMKKSNLKSTLKIGSNIALGESLLPDLTSDFQSKYPKIHFSITVDHSSNIEHMLLKNQLDLAIIDSSPSSPVFEDLVLVRKKISTFCSKDYPLVLNKTYTLGKISKMPLLVREKGCDMRTMIEDMFLSNGFTMNHILESPSIATLIRFALEGMGFLIIDSDMIQDLLNKDLLHPVPTTLPELSYSYHLLYHPKKLMTDSMEKFIEHISDRFHDDNYLDYII